MSQEDDELEDKRERFDPEVTGRFNYFSYTKDLFNIMFVPYFSEASIIIARNLTRDEMNGLLKRLNGELDITQTMIKDMLRRRE